MLFLDWSLNESWFKIQEMVDSYLPEVGSSQFYGIIIGCLVYALTIGVVGYLFIKGGSLGRLQEEANGTTKSTIKHLPSVLLHDYLLNASKTLPRKLNFPLLGVEGRFVRVRAIQLKNQNDLTSIFHISNGDAVYGFDSYDSYESIWKHVRSGPFSQEQDMLGFFDDLPDNRHLLIVRFA